MIDPSAPQRIHADFQSSFEHGLFLTFPHGCSDSSPTSASLGVESTPKEDVALRGQQGPAPTVHGTWLYEDAPQLGITGTWTAGEEHGLQGSYALVQGRYVDLGRPAATLNLRAYTTAPWDGDTALPWADTARALPKRPAGEEKPAGDPAKLQPAGQPADVEQAAQEESPWGCRSLRQILAGERAASVPVRPPREELLFFEKFFSSRTNWLQYSAGARPRGHFPFDPSSTEKLSHHKLERLRDIYDTHAVEVRVCAGIPQPGGESADPGEGLYAKRDFEAGELVCLYGGIRLTQTQCDARSWEDNANCVTLHKCGAPASEGEASSEASSSEGGSAGESGDVVLDIPRAFNTMEKYCATVGHKANHSDSANAYYDKFEGHPRFGDVCCIRALNFIKKGEEICCNYGYANEEEYPPWWQGGT